MRESEIESKSVKEAAKHGWYSFKLLANLNKGLPDRCFLNGGKVVFIEYKTATGKLSKLQTYMANKFGEHGVTVHVARSVEDTMEILNNA